MNNSEKHPSETQRDHEESPFVSVIMNCYNGARFLRDALESVRAQSFTDWELVFWDNRSTDESASIFRSFEDTRFSYFLAPEHTILAPAKNFAVERATGEWLAFLDCDDLWESDKLEQQAAIIREEGPGLGLVYGRMGLLIEDGARNTTLARSARVGDMTHNGDWLPEGNIFSYLLLENFVPQPSATIRRSIYLAVGGVNPTFRHCWDYDLWLKTCKEFRARAIQEVCCNYRIHDNNLSHVQVEASCLEKIVILKQYLHEPNAARGISSVKASYAKFLFSQQRWSEGCALILNFQDFSVFVLETYRFLKRRFQFFVKSSRLLG